MHTRPSPAGPEAPANAASDVGIRWSAIFAGLVVGLSLHGVLMLVGGAIGLAVLGSGMRPVGLAGVMLAAVWNTLSMLLAAFVGGYIAARGGGVQRVGDGVLHGVVTWGASVLFAALLGAALGGVLTGSLAGMTATAARVQAEEPSASAFIASVERGDRTAAERLLREEFGLDDEQAVRLAAQALALRQHLAEAGGERALDAAAQAASAVSTWLALTTLLALLAAAGGGYMGVTGLSRRQPGPLHEYAEPRLGPAPAGGERIPPAL